MKGRHADVRRGKRLQNGVPQAVVGKSSAGPDQTSRPTWDKRRRRTRGLQDAHVVKGNGPGPNRDAGLRGDCVGLSFSAATEPVFAEIHSDGVGHKESGAIDSMGWETGEGAGTPSFSTKIPSRLRSLSMATVKSRNLWWHRFQQRPGSMGPSKPVPDGVLGQQQINRKSRAH